MEVRVCWAASSNIGFRGASDWVDYEEWYGAVNDKDASIEEIEDYMYSGAHIPPGLELALEASGFEWWVEIR